VSSAAYTSTGIDLSEINVYNIRSLGVLAVSSVKIGTAVETCNGSISRWLYEYDITTFYTGHI